VSILRPITRLLKGALQPFGRLCRSLLFDRVTWILSALCLIFLSGKFADPPSKAHAATLQVKGTTQNTPAVEIPDDAGVVNVKSFGAKGDGVSDDTAAITNATSGRLQMLLSIFRTVPILLAHHCSIRTAIHGERTWASGSEPNRDDPQVGR
jgi:hypothetical protein